MSSYLAAHSLVCQMLCQVVCIENMSNVLVILMQSLISCVTKFFFVIVVCKDTLVRGGVTSTWNY